MNISNIHNSLSVNNVLLNSNDCNGSIFLFFKSPVIIIILYILLFLGFLCCISTLYLYLYIYTLLYFHSLQCITSTDTSILCCSFSKSLPCLQTISSNMGLRRVAVLSDPKPTVNILAFRLMISLFCHVSH